MSKKVYYGALKRFLMDYYLNVPTAAAAGADIFESGLGQLKELLLPLGKKELWGPSDLPYYDDVSDIHRALKENLDEKQYTGVVRSLKNSLLTSFYTPVPIAGAIVKGIKAAGQEEISAILDPAAGTGNFLRPLLNHFPGASVKAIEKDQLAYMIMTSRYDNVNAENKPFEEDTTSGYGLVISNIPFGSVNVYDAEYFTEKDPIKIKATTRIHNYYFVKALDKTKEGGIVAFITSSGTSDSEGNKFIREYLVAKADLISALRLPDNIFKSSGTQATSDLIVLRKNSLKKTMSKDEQLFINTMEKQLENEKGEPVSVKTSRYFDAYPERVLGMPYAGGQYGNKVMSVSSASTVDEIAGKIEGFLSKERVQKLANIKPPGQSSQVSNSGVKNGLVAIPENVRINPHIKENNLIVFQGKVGHYVLEQGKPHFREEKAIKDVQRAFGIVAIRNMYNTLLAAETGGLEDDQTEKVRKELNRAYDQFNWQYGPLKHPSNAKLISFDVEDYKLLSLEEKKGNKYEKADIFSKRVNNKEAQVTIEGLEEAILYSLDRTNKIDISLMAAVLQKEKDVVAREGLEKGLLYIEPVKEGRYKLVTQDEFISGNIVGKLEALHEFGLPEKWQDYHDGHKEKLLYAKPAALSFEIIDINFGERWIREEIYADFATALFGQETSVKYMASTDGYKVAIKGYSDISGREYAVNTDYGTYSAEKIMECALHDVTPNITKPAGGDNNNRVPDQEAIRNAERKAQEIKDKFNEFILNNPAYKSEIEKEYNSKFNYAVKRKYNGAHLTFPGLQGYELYAHQKDGVWMVVQRDGGVVDHKVGAGKTLVMINAAIKMKQLGLSQKPMITALKANVKSIYEDFMSSYPNAKVLCPDEKDFTVKNRKMMFQKIMNNEYDCIIVTHDQFKMIPQSREKIKEVLEKEIKNLEDDLYAIEGSGISKRMLKGLEKRKENLEVQLQGYEASIKRDPYIVDFDKMGIDHLFVDESQEFKNLHYTTRHGQVSGLGSPKGSQRAFNLEIACMTIQEKKGGDKGITFLSGTTLSNSLVELYSIFKYLRRGELERQKINSFDSWAKMYARKSNDYEFSVTGEVKRKERFREFVKVPELARFYAEMADVVNDNNLKFDKPGLNTQLVSLPPTSQQEEFGHDLIQFAKTKDGSHIGLYLSETEKQAYMLIATNLAKKMSIDMRLIDDENYYFEDGFKGVKLASVVAQKWKAFDFCKGTQLIFCDTSTPKKDKFNMYDEIKRLLVEAHNMPAAQIAFIHDYNTRKQREALFEKVNKGDIRVVIGSTKKLGTGVNVQKRVVAMHHLDIPWRPSDLEQRMGRGARQGNEVAKKHNNNQVGNYIYAVEKTLDSYQFNILSNKQKFIDQIKDASISQRKIDEGAMDEDGGMNFSEYVALLSGNTDLLEKAKLEKKLIDVENRYNAFLVEQSQAKHSIAHLSEKNHKQTAVLASLKIDYEKFNGLFLPKLKGNDNEKFAYKVPVHCNGKAYNDPKALGETLLNMVEKQKGVSNVPLASWGAFELIKTAGEDVMVTSPTGIKYNYSNNRLNENPTLAGKYIFNSLMRLEKLIETTAASINGNTKRIEIDNKILAKGFPDKVQIHKIRNEIKALEDKMDSRHAVENVENHKANEPSVGGVAF